MTRLELLARLRRTTVEMTKASSQKWSRASRPLLKKQVARMQGCGMRRLHTRRAHEVIRCFPCLCQLTYGNGPLCAMFHYATKRECFRVMETVRGVDCVALEP